MISIITINRNNAAGLRKTLESVARQGWGDFEHIVIDGASDDASVDLLRSGEYKVSRWISEPDGGIYDAQNKGVRLAAGTFVLFINSGDHFCDDSSLETAARRLDSADIQAFDAIVRDYYLGGRDGVEFVNRAPNRLCFPFFFQTTLPHQSTFIRRGLFEMYGYYDTQLKIAADWKAFMLWACRHNCSYRHHEFAISVYYGDGISSQPDNVPKLLAERKKVLQEEFPAFLDSAGGLLECSAASLNIKALRASKIVRLLQAARLLWKF